MWDSFANGYIFEVAVYRDLKAAGVAFVAHDIIDPEQRRLSYDLLVSGWRGDFEDIPTDTFFAALEKVGAHRPTQHVEMEEVVGDRLVFIPPEGVPLPFTVHDNEIILGDYTIRVRLKGVQLAVLAETPDSANVNGE